MIEFKKYSKEGIAYMVYQDDEMIGSTTMRDNIYLYQQELITILTSNELRQIAEKLDQLNQEVKDD